MEKKPQSSPVKTITKTPVKKSKQQNLSIFTFVIVAITLVGVLFLWQQNIRKTKTIQSIETQLITIKKTHEQQDKAQQALQLALAQLQSQQNKLSTYQNWNIAGYLIRLAHIEHNLLHNPQQSEQLLVSAAAALAVDESPRARTLKTAISDDLNRLNKISAENTPKTLSEINALNQQIMLLTPNSQKQFHLKFDKKTPPKGSWWNHLKYSFKDFENLVVIRHEDQPIQPLLTPENFTLLKAAIRIQLGIAQWALISEQTQTYQMALQNAAAWLTQYASQNNQAQQIAKQLDVLSKKPVVTIPANSLESWDVWKKLDKEN